MMVNPYSVKELMGNNIMRSVKRKNKQKESLTLPTRVYYKGGLNMFYQGSIFQRSSITYLIS